MSVRRSRTLAAGAALLGLLALASAVLAWLVLDLRPALPPAPVASSSPLGDLRRLLRSHAVPAQDGTGQVIELPAPELARLAGETAHFLGARLALRAGDGTVELRASLPLRAGPWSAWVNLQATLDDGAGWPDLRSLRLGQLPLPASLAAAALPWFGPRWLGDDPYAALAEAVQQVTVSPALIRVELRGPIDPAVGLATWLQPAAQRKRMDAYLQRLAELAAGARGDIDLASLLAPMARLALRRSEAAGDPAAENRAWLQVLALYVTGRHHGPGPGVPRPRRRLVTLDGRVDFPQHFLVSAALAAGAGGPAADAIGLVKEVDDARFGSGFSFTDLAVNRAGQRFGGLARTDARRLQQRLADGVTAQALLPRVHDLPEFLPAAEFERRFGGVDGEPFRQLMADIDRRIDALPLYR